MLWELPGRSVHFRAAFFEQHGKTIHRGLHTPPHIHADHAVTILYRLEKIFLVNLVMPSTLSSVLTIKVT